MSSSSGTDGLSLAKGGPATPGGKEVVKWNSTQHGILSPAPVIPGIERTEAWEEHRDGILRSLQPEGHLELVLAGDALPPPREYAAFVTAVDVGCLTPALRKGEKDATSDPSFDDDGRNAGRSQWGSPGGEQDRH
jgi:hypothetical protein